LSVARGCRFGSSRTPHASGPAMFRCWLEIPGV